MKLARENAPSFIFPKQYSAVQLVHPGGHVSPAPLPASSGKWTWPWFCGQRGPVPQRAKSFCFSGGDDLTVGEDGRKAGDKKAALVRGLDRVWRMSWLGLVVLCMCMVTGQALIHWAMSSGVDRDAQGSELAADQIFLTFSIEAEVLGLVVNSTGPAKAGPPGPPAALQGLLQNWAQGHTQLADTPCGLTFVQQTQTRRLQERTEVAAAAFSATVGGFQPSGSVGAVRAAGATYRGLLGELRDECGKQRVGGENLILGLTWALTLLGVGVTSVLVVGVLRSLVKRTTAVVGRHEQVLKDKASQDAVSRRASALQLGYISHELRNPLNGVMGLIHLCLSMVTPASGSRRSSRQVGNEPGDDAPALPGVDLMRLIESPGRDENGFGRKRPSSDMDMSELLNKSWPDALRARAVSQDGYLAVLPEVNLLARQSKLPRLPYLDSPTRTVLLPGRGGAKKEGDGCEICHGLVYDNLSLADKSCELMKTIMGDLLDMQRLEAGQVVMARTTGTFLDVIRHVTRLAETQVMMHGAAIDTISRIRSHSRRMTGSASLAAVDRAVRAEAGGNLSPGGIKAADPPGKKVRGRWEWVQAEGKRVGEGRVNGRAIVRYTCDAEVSRVNFEMDQPRMEQIVSSLVTNALLATRPEDNCPELRASALDSEGGLRLEVSDSGPGLSAAARESVFEPFLHTYYQEQGLTLGVGLSLYISKLLVTKLMHGSIGFSSEEGFGSTFWVELPLARVQSPGPSLSFTTASFASGSPSDRSPHAKQDGVKALPSSSAGENPSASTAPSKIEKEDFLPACILREPPQLARAGEQTPTRTAPEQTPRNLLDEALEGRPRNARRAPEKANVTPRSVSQIEVAAPRGSLRKGSLGSPSHPGMPAPTTAASRKELFRWSSVLVAAGPSSTEPENGRLPEPRPPDFLVSQHRVHSVAEDDGEAEGAAAAAAALTKPARTIARPSPKRIAAKDGRKLHCLVVDDVHTNRLVLQKILHVLGHTCDTAVNGLEAVAAVTGRRPSVDGQQQGRIDDEEETTPRSYDLILMDVQMPIMDGRRATELIRHWEIQRLSKARASPGESPEENMHGMLPIIFVTGNVMPGEEALMLSSGATKVIEKPMRMNDLRELIRIYVHERSPGAQLRPLNGYPLFGRTDGERTRGD